MIESDHEEERRQRIDAIVERLTKATSDRHVLSDTTAIVVEMPELSRRAPRRPPRK